MSVRALHRLCARPMLICCTVGAGVMNAAVLLIPLEGSRLVSVAADLQGCLLLLLAVVGATGLGCFAGIFTCWPWMRRRCAHFNGAPFRSGDRVLILAGKHRGSDSMVEDVTRGQGGQDVLWVRVETEQGRADQAILEEYSVLKVSQIARDEPCVRVPELP